MSKPLNDKIALVTGGARGIGRDIALRLAARGAGVAVVDVQEDAALETAREIETHGVRSAAFACDVGDLDDVNALRERYGKVFDRIDILVNNAGITRDRLLMRMTAEDWELVLRVNLTGAFHFCKVFGPAMLRARSGCVVNIASVVGQMGNAGQANYAASKAGLIGLTKSLAKEFAVRGVRVNAVAPGFIRTAMTDALPADVQDNMKAMIPLGRFGETADVADIVYFLVSDLSRYVTGQVVNCDGGMIMSR